MEISDYSRSILAGIFTWTRSTLINNPYSNFYYLELTAPELATSDTTSMYIRYELNNKLPDTDNSAHSATLSVPLNEFTVQLLQHHKPISKQCLINSYLDAFYNYMSSDKSDDTLQLLNRISYELFRLYYLGR